MSPPTPWMRPWSPCILRCSPRSSRLACPRMLLRQRASLGHRQKHGQKSRETDFRCARRVLELLAPRRTRNTEPTRGSTMISRGARRHRRRHRTTGGAGGKRPRGGAAAPFARLGRDDLLLGAAFRRRERVGRPQEGVVDDHLEDGPTPRRGTSFFQMIIIGLNDVREEEALAHVLREPRERLEAAPRQRRADGGPRHEDAVLGVVLVGRAAVQQVVAAELEPRFGDVALVAEVREGRQARGERRGRVRRPSRRVGDDVCRSSPSRPGDA
mmetsp:Transcript_14422/g.57464  ORF Transcript_14422/g.57464 Transcript_14422/m.57464 type:complete len:270 (+) Transcript_14422:51-860(+)